MREFPKTFPGDAGEHLLLHCFCSLSTLQPTTQMWWIPSWTMKMRDTPQGRKSSKLDGTMEQDCQRPDYQALELSARNKLLTWLSHCHFECLSLAAEPNHSWSRIWYRIGDAAGNPTLIFFFLYAPEGLKEPANPPVFKFFTLLLP